MNDDLRQSVEEAIDNFRKLDRIGLLIIQSNVEALRMRQLMEENEKETKKTA